MKKRELKALTDALAFLSSRGYHDQARLIQQVLDREKHFLQLRNKQAAANRIAEKQAKVESQGIEP